MSGQLYPDYLSFIGFVSAVVTQYFVSCDVGLKPNKTKYKIVFSHGFILSGIPFG